MRRLFLLAACGPPQVPPAPPQPPPPVAIADAAIDAPPPDLALVHEAAPPVVPMLHAVQTQNVLQRLPAPDVTALGFDATGNRLAAFADTTLLVLDVASGAIAARAWPIDGPPLAFSLDGTRVAVGTDAVSIVDLAHASVGDPIACPHATAAWAPDGALVLACDDAIRVFDASERFAVLRHGPAIAAASLISPDGTRVAISGDGTLDLRALDDGHRLASAVGEPVLDLAWRPDGLALAVTGRTSTRVLDAQLADVATRDTGAPAIAYAPDGHAVAFAGDPPLAWTVATGEVQSLDFGAATRVHWFADGLAIDTPDLDGVIERGGNRLGVFCQGGCGDLAVAWSHDGTRAADRDNGTVVALDTATGASLARFRQLSRDRPQLSEDALVALLPYHQRALDLVTGKATSLPPRMGLQLSPDGARAYAEKDKGWIAVSTRTGKTIAAQPHMPVHLRDLHVSGDGAWLYDLVEDHTKHLVLHVWPATTGTERTIALPAGARDAIAIPHTAKLFERNTRSVVDLATGKTRAISGTGRTAYAASADGTRIAVDRVVYDTATLAQIDTLAGDPRALTPHGDAVVVDDGLHAVGGGTTPFSAPGELAWSPDGTLLIAGDNQVWDGRGQAPIVALGRPMRWLGNHCVIDDVAGFHILRLSGEWLDIAIVDGTLVASEPIAEFVAACR